MGFRNAVKGFLKFALSEESGLENSLPSLKKCFKSPNRGSILIQAEPYSGATAILLELTESYTSQGKLVIYIDVKDSLIKNRLAGVDLSKLTVVKPNSIEEILDLVEEFRGHKPVYILDSIGYIRDKWNLSESPFRLAERIRKIDPNSLVVCTKTLRKANVLQDYNWSIHLTVRSIKRRYENRIRVGHLISIAGPSGTSRAYIDYNSGRLSKAYEHASEEVNSGVKTKHSEFELDGISAKGMWNFIGCYEREINQRRKRMAD